MKKGLFAILLSASVSIIACQKETSEPANALTVSKTTAIKRGEPVVFTMATTQTVAWRISPYAGVLINATGNQASIRFAYAGQYVVTATMGIDSISTPVTVMDSVYPGPDGLPNGSDTANLPPAPAGDTVLFSGDEVLQLTPAVVVDSSGRSGLFITSSTTNDYNCNANSLLSRLDTSGGQYQIDYPGVYVPRSCSPGQRPAVALLPVFYPADGSYVFRIVAGGKTYAGSFKKEGGTYTFTWPYSTGVTVAPLVVQ